MVSINSVDKQFDNQVVLNNICLDVEQGEFLTLLGPSGCGKTTLLKIISGFVIPDSGTVTIAGKNMANIPPNQRHVNTVFQNYALFPHMTVFDNVAFGLRCQKKFSEKTIRQEVKLILNKVHLPGFEQRKPENLSGGQQQRIAIARALINRPYVLLLDEPMSALDYRLRKRMQIELKALQREIGSTFICVTHDQEEALSMSDRVAVMEDGVITQLATPKEVYEEPHDIAVAKFIGEANFLDTTILNVADNLITVEIEGKKIVLKNPRQYSIDSNVTTLVRPEDLKVWGINEVTPSEKMYRAFVVEVVYKGSTVDLILDLATGTRLLATEFFDEDDEELEYRIGENVFIEWLPGWEVILPKDDCFE